MTTPVPDEPPREPFGELQPLPGEPAGAGAGGEDWVYAQNVDVGAFEQGGEFSRWALARYIVGRVVLERVSWSLLAIALVLLVLAGLAEFALHSTLLAVLLVVVALAVLVMRLLLRAILHRLMGAAAYGPLEQRVRGIVDEAGSGVVQEMKRVGLPSGLLTIPLVVPRLIGRRRRETLERMRRFDVERAVPKAKRDELYLALREALGNRPPYG